MIFQSNEDHVVYILFQKPKVLSSELPLSVRIMLARPHLHQRLQLATYTYVTLAMNLSASVCSIWYVADHMNILLEKGQLWQWRHGGPRAGKEQISLPIQPSPFQTYTSISCCLLYS